MSIINQKQLTVLAAMFVYAATATLPVRAAEILFRWKVKAGDKFQVVTVQDMTMESKMGDKDMTMPMKNTIDMTWLVKDVDDKGLIHMAQTIDRMQMRQSIPNAGDLNFDSDSKEPPAGMAAMLAGMIKPMIGKSFEQVMNSRGGIQEVHVPAEAFEGLKQNPGMQGMFSEESMTNMIRQGSPTLPEQAISDGYSWDSQMAIDMPFGKMNTEMTYTYQGLIKDESGRTVGKFTVDMKLNLENSSNAAGPRIQIADQKNSGTLLFDPHAGQLTESEIHQDMTMNVTFQGAAIEQKTKSTTKMTWNRLRD